MPCAACTFWELGPVAAAQAGRHETSAADALETKAAWLSATLREWGHCGQIMVVDDEVAGFVTYAPPHLVGRADAFPTSPVSADAVLLLALRVAPHLQGAGFGRVLLQSAAKDVSRRGVRAIEAFGDGRALTSAAEAPTSERGIGDDNAQTPDVMPSRCLLPVSFLEELGFAVVRPHSRFPRLRLDMRATASWREDVETALERLLGSITEPVLRPV